MDDEVNGQWVKAAIGIVVIFIVSLWASCSEIRYLAFGKVTTATVRHCEVVEDRRQRKSAHLQVRYSFKDDDGQERIEGAQADATLQAKFAKGSKIEVQYVPRRIGESRLVGQNNWWLTLPLAISILATIGFVMWMYRDVRQYERAVARRNGLS